MEVEIIGVTNIWLLNVPYIAIDPSFPHHLNSFDNVPVNYSNSNLVNISTKSTTLQTYTNRINYTQQAGSRTFKQFSVPLENSKVLLFLTTLFIKGTNENLFPGIYPIDMNIYTEIESTSEYSITVTLETKINIIRLHFSQLIFDAEEVQKTRKYVLVYQNLNFDVSGGFI